MISEMILQKGPVDEIPELVGYDSSRIDALNLHLWRMIEDNRLDLRRGEKMIALGDKLSNVRAMYYDYQVIGDKLWERFNQKDKSEHKVSKGRFC